MTLDNLSTYNIIYGVTCGVKRRGAVLQKKRGKRSVRRNASYFNGTELTARRPCRAGRRAGRREWGRAERGRGRAGGLRFWMRAQRMLISSGRAARLRDRASFSDAVQNAAGERVLRVWNHASAAGSPPSAFTRPSVAMMMASPGRRCAEATDGVASATTPTGSDAPSIRLAVRPRRSHVGSRRTCESAPFPWRDRFRTRPAWKTLRARRRTAG